MLAAKGRLGGEERRRRGGERVITGEEVGESGLEDHQWQGYGPAGRGACSLL